MDQHFRVLGLKRGCSGDELKKAYRQKALEYHPDRNPAGSDTFKRINAAYETLTAHFKRYGGRDGGLHSSGGASNTGNARYSSNYNNGSASPNSGGGTGYRYAQYHQTSSYRPPDDGGTPLFTDEELFGDAVPGGWSFGKKSYFENYAAAAASAAAHSQAEARRRRAHGDRVPMSGYNGGPSGAAPPMYARTFDEFKNMFEAHMKRTAAYASTPTTPSDTTGASDSNQQRSQPAEDPDPEDEEGETSGSDGFTALWRELNKLSSEAEKKKALREEWDRLERNLSEKLREQQAQEAERERRDRAEAEALHKRIARENRAEAARQEEEARIRADAAAAEAFQRKMRDARSEAHTDSILHERRMLQKQLFTQRYVPDPADVGDMTDMEVFILTDLYCDISKKLQGVWNARLQRGACSRCQKNPKDPSSGRRFTCINHPAMCSSCAEVAKECPLCGAAATKVPYPSARSNNGSQSPTSSSPTEGRNNNHQPSRADDSDARATARANSASDAAAGVRPPSTPSSPPSSASLNHPTAGNTTTLPPIRGSRTNTPVSTPRVAPSVNALYNSGAANTKNTNTTNTNNCDRTVESGQAAAVMPPTRPAKSCASSPKLSPPAGGTNNSNNKPTTVGSASRRASAPAPSVPESTAGTSRISGDSTESQKKAASVPLFSQEEEVNRA